MSLKLARIHLLAHELYKLELGLLPEYISKLFVKSQHRYETRNKTSGSFEIPTVVTTKFGLYSIVFQGPKLWNSKTEQMKASKSLVDFKTNIHNWSGNDCMCCWNTNNTVNWLLHKSRGAQLPTVFQPLDFNSWISNAGLSI